MRKGTKGMLGEKLMTLRKKSGYSQQELADRLKVSRQTISNWELNQGAPSIGKAKELADIYKISLDDLVGDEVEVVARKKREPDLHVLKRLVGKMVKLECSDIDLALEEGNDFFSIGKVKVLEVDGEWLRVEYQRTKEKSIFQKEKVVKLIELSAVEAFEVLEEKEVL